MGLSSSPKIYLFAAYLTLAFMASACQVATKRGDSTNEQNENAPLVDEKYSLTADRKELDQLRSQIPAEKRKENDELALLNQFFADPKKSPSDVRSKFDSLLRKKRELFQKDMTKERETYVREERKRREQFNKELEETRRDFQKKKVSQEQRTEFYSEQDGKRKEFYAEERQKRDEFEEGMRDKRKNFDDYAREKNSEFAQELRAYTKRYEELQKAEKNK